MKSQPETEDKPASELISEKISEKIGELGDWRGETLAADYAYIFLIPQ